MPQEETAGPEEATSASAVGPNSREREAVHDCLLEQLGNTEITEEQAVVSKLMFLADEDRAER